MTRTTIKTRCKWRWNELWCRLRECGIHFATSFARLRSFTLWQSVLTKVWDGEVFDLDLEPGKSMRIFGVRRVVYSWSSNFCGVGDELGTLNAVLRTHPERKNHLSLYDELGFLIVILLPLSFPGRCARRWFFQWKFLTPVTPNEWFRVVDFMKTAP